MLLCCPLLAELRWLLTAWITLLPVGMEGWPEVGISSATTRKQETRSAASSLELVFKVSFEGHDIMRVTNTNCQ